MAFATGRDFLTRYDVRLTGDLVKDDGVQEPPASLEEHPVLVAMLDDASAAIQSALVTGNRYTLDQLTSLSDASLAFLRRLTVDLALIYLKRRRGRFDPERDGSLLKEVNAVLDSLKNGGDLLMVATATEAAASTIQLVTPALVTVPSRQTIRSNTNNYYPQPRR